MGTESTNPETIVLHAGWRKDETTNAVAVPIYSPTREIEAVMAGGIPSRFMTEMRLRQMAGPAFVHAAARLSETMGFAGPAARSTA